MNKVVGFYSHIPIAISRGNMYAPSFIGKYLDRLAYSVDELVLYGHIIDFDSSDQDYCLKSPKINFINMGVKRSSVVRLLFGFIYFFNLKKSNLDHMIVRSPSPISPWFRVFFRRKKLHFLLVADEKEGALNKEVNGFRDLVVKYFLRFSDVILSTCVRGTSSFVNSRALHLKYIKNKDIKVISTSNLQSNDFVAKVNFDIHTPLRILYVGRLDLSKGIIETLEAIKVLNSTGIECQYNIVGWDETSGRNKMIISSKVDELEISELVTFAGKISHGADLNDIYRNSDIYIIASYHEGFPRTILESMANSTAVIASSVGAIPIELQNDIHAILIRPKSVEDIVSGVKKIIDDAALRRRIIANGYNLSRKKNIDSGVEELIRHLDDQVL